MNVFASAAHTWFVWPGQQSFGSEQWMKILLSHSKKRKGGLRQRLEASRRESAEHDQAAQAASTRSFLAEYLLEQWAWGNFSPQQVQCIAALFKKDAEALGVRHVQSSLATLANLGSEGRHANNVHRDLMNVVKEKTHMPEPLYANMPLKSKWPLQAVMLPHLVFHHLYTHYQDFWNKVFLPAGVEGLAAFWHHFGKHPCMLDFHGSRDQWQRWTIPLNIHGDAVPTIGCGKIWTKMLQAYSWTGLLPRGSTKQRSFFFGAAPWSTRIWKLSVSICAYTCGRITGGGAAA